MHWICFKKLCLGIGEMAQWLRVHAASAEDPAPTATALNFIFMGFDGLFWPQWAPAWHMPTQTHTDR